MVLKFLKLFRKKENKILVENFLSLSFLQVANYILPLLTLPYLVRVLGPEKFGLTAFAQAFVLYFILFTDFGFNLSATKEISINRNNNDKVSRIFVSIFLIKFILLIISFSIFIFLIHFINRFIEEKLFFFLNFSTVIGWFLFPQWFFQGIEKMKFVTFINFLGKIILTITTFIFIRTQNDYIIYPFLNFIGLFISGIISLCVAFQIYNLKMLLPDKHMIKEQFILGFQIFISNIAINLYTASNSFILGFLTNNTIVGYYSSAEKVLKAFQYLSIPLYQAIFPRFSKIINENREKAIYLFNNLLKLVLIFTSLLVVMVFFSSPVIIKVLFGNSYSKSIKILSILSFSLIFSWGNYALGILGLINFGYEKTFSKIVLLCGLFHILLLLIGIKIFGFYSVPIIWVFTEMIIFVICFKVLMGLGIIQMKYFIPRFLNIFKKQY